MTKSLDENALRASLPQTLSRRLVSVAVKGTVVTAILDASGLDGAGRALLEQVTGEILGAVQGVEELRLALTADRPSDSPADRPSNIPADRSSDISADRPSDSPADRPKGGGAEPQATAQNTADPNTSGQENSGPNTASPNTAGQNNSGPNTSGPNTISPQSAPSQSTPPQSAPSQSPSSQSTGPKPKRPPLIAIGSGKGGVGKSTLTANLAAALKAQGKRVGIVDADIYGPSQPTLFGNQGERPRAEEKRLIPVPSEAGIAVLSMGHLVEPGKAIAWRGPMAGNALSQLIDAHWDDVDLLLVDLPPGTGDVQLTMLQRFKPSGAVIISSPQDLALIDAQRAAHLFDSAKVPIIGLVENMAGYICPHCGDVSAPFGRGGVEQAAQAGEVDFLGRIPLDHKIQAHSDAGTPIAMQEGPQAQAFHRIAQKLGEWLGHMQGNSFVDNPPIVSSQPDDGSAHDEHKVKGAR